MKRYLCDRCEIILSGEKETQIRWEGSRDGPQSEAHEIFHFCAECLVAVMKKVRQKKTPF